MNRTRLVVALCFALLSSGLLTWQLSRHLAHNLPLAPSVPLREIVVASRAMGAGEALSAADLSTLTLPTSHPLIGVFGKRSEVTGRVLLVPVSAGEIVSAHALASPDIAPGVSGTIPKGMRVVSVPVTEPFAGNSDLLAPGTRVDIFVSYRSEAEGFLSALILQNIFVVDRGHTGSKEADAARILGNNVELLVTPEGAARLAVASSLGKLTFALRNGKDDSLTPGLSHVALSYSTEPSQKRGAAPALKHDSGPSGQQTSRFTVETLSGGKVSVQTFPESSK